MIRKIKDVWHGKALVRIGKRGLTPQVIEEIRRHLKDKEVVKIRLLKSFIEKEGKERKALAEIIAKNVGAELIGVRGYTVVLRRRKKA